MNSRMLRNYSICGRVITIGAPFFPADSENWQKFLVESAKSHITVECKVAENLPEINAEWVKKGDCSYFTDGDVLCKRINMGTADGAVIKTKLNDPSQKEVTFVEGSFKTLMDERYMWSTIGLAESLLHFVALLLHASFIEVDGEAILFTAPCQTGKSTQAELWRQHCGANVINGDKAGILYDGGKVYACGVPFCGTSGICHNETLPLGAIIFLSQSPENTLRKCVGFEALHNVMQNTYLDFVAPDEQRRFVDTAIKMLNSVPVYHLGCTPDEGAVITLEKTLKAEGVI